MKKFKVLAGMLLAAIVASGAAGVGTLSVFAQQTAPEESTRAEISLDDDFDGTSVLVTMTEEVSEINKEYDPSYFGDIAISSIEDLTYMTGNVRDKKYFDESKFKQILKINLPTDSKANVIEAIGKIEEMEGVLSASPNYYERLANIPNDDFYPNLWGLGYGNGSYAVDAWDITTGSRDVKVGVIDTGIANHPDLDANLTSGWDFVNDNNVTSDDPTGHGTHVAGIIGACGNNAKGVVGVNWQVTLVPMQVVYWDTKENDWIVDSSATVEAINWAKNNNIPILNYSAGFYNSMFIVQVALETYTGLFVCSAGNDGLNTDETKHYPSEYSDESNSFFSLISDRVISVGSINSQGNRATDSNYGAKSISIFAPGVNIYSTVPQSINSTRYTSFSGTSMAAPHVAGVAALMLSLDDTLTAAELKTIICETADKSSALNGLCVTGGRLNAFRAVASVAYEVNSRGTITGLNFEPGEILVIPDQIGQETVRGIAADVFANYQTLKELDLPSSITSIGDRAFANTSLHQVTMSVGGTVSMGSDVFQGCTELQYVTLNATLRGTCDGLFDGCSALISVSIDDYSYVGEDMFRNCSSLASISVPSTVTHIYDRAFYGCSGLESVTLPDTLSTIGFDAFNGCSSLVSVTIPSKAECHLWINNRAFMDCTSLSHVTIVNEIDMIGADVFQGTSLETLSVPSVEYLGDFFGGGTAENPNAGVPDSLTTVSITGNQTAVGAGAFQGCEYLLWVTLPSSVMSIGSQAFSGSGITEIALPRTVRSIAEDAFSYCSSVESITVASGNLYYAGTGDCLIRKSDQTLVLGCKNSVIPSSVKVIGENAFRWCSDLTEIEVPSNVTDIDLYAFSNPDLKSISLPYSVKFVSMRLALLESEDLESIHFYGDGVYQIGVADEEEVLLRWRNLTGVYVDDGEAALAYRTDDAWKVYADLIFVKEPSDTCFVLVTDDDSEYFSAEKTIAELYQNEFRAILTLDVTETGGLAPTALATLETQLDALMETGSVMLELYLTRLQSESYQYLLNWCRSSQGEFMDEWTAIYQTAGTVQIIDSNNQEREIWGNVYELGRKTAQAYCNSSVDPDENITNMYGFLGYFPIFGNTTLKNDIAFLWGIHTYFEEHTDGVAWGDLVVLTEYQQIAEALSKINETMGVETLWLFVDRDPREFAEVFEEYEIGPEEILLVGSRAFLEQHGKIALLDENYHVFEYAYEYDALFRIVLPFGYYEDPGFLDEVFYSEEFDAFLETYQFQINTWQMFAEYYESFQQGICNRDELIDFYEEQYFFQMMDELQYCENAFLSAEFYDPLI